MRTIQFIYNQSDDLKQFQQYIQNKNFKVELYNENSFRDKKKALMIKAKYGAVLLPFVVIKSTYAECKVFYQESGNALQHFNNYINKQPPIDEEPFIKFITQCYEKSIPLKDMLNIIQILYQKLYPDNTYEKRRISNNANKTS